MTTPIQPTPAASTPATADWAKDAADALIEAYGLQQWSTFKERAAAIIRTHAPVTPTEQRLREALVAARLQIFLEQRAPEVVLREIDAALATPSGMEGGTK